MRVEIRMNDRKGIYVTTPSSGKSLLHVASGAVGGFVQNVSGLGASYARNVSSSAFYWIVMCCNSKNEN